MKDYPYFKAEELRCSCGCDGEMDEKFMKKLVALRGHCGFPFIVTSAYRCEDYNEKIGGADSSMHLKGRAVDVAVRGARAYEVVASARAFGMNGVGVNQKGDGRFIHLDDRETPAFWSY